MSDDKKKVGKISKESAGGQIDSFCEFYDLDPEDMSDRMRGPHEETRLRLAKHIIKGRIELDGAKVTQTIKGGKTLQYAVLQGKHKVEMAKCESDDHTMKMYALCASLTGLHPTGIYKLEGVDLSALECMGMLFLQI